jgi:Holliday junction resolvase
MSGTSAKKKKSTGAHKKRKGGEGEREVANIFNDRGLKSRRTVQYNGQAGDSDILVEELSEFFFEVKRQNLINLHEWWKQVTADAKGKTPVLVFRRDRDEWRVVMSLTDWITLAKEKLCSCKGTILNISRVEDSSEKA